MRAPQGEISNHGLFLQRSRLSRAAPRSGVGLDELLCGSGALVVPHSPIVSVLYPDGTA